MEELRNEEAILAPEQSANAQEVSLGKFKNGAMLLEAYNNLEKEFTKKSQKLKALETRDIETSPMTASDDVAEAIKRVSNINPELGELLVGASSNNADNKEGQNTPIVDFIARALSGKILPQGEANESKYISEILSRSGELRERLFIELLDGLPQAKSPKLNKNRGQTVLTPPKRPKSITEAGRMAENIIYNRSK